MTEYAVAEMRLEDARYFLQRHRRYCRWPAATCWWDMCRSMAVEAAEAELRRLELEAA